MRSIDVNKYLTLQEQARGDEYYLSLLEEYRVLDQKLVAALEEMAPAHRDIVMDYLGCVFALQQRMLELSIASCEKS